jgi:hypothetical protein
MEKLDWTSRDVVLLLTGCYNAKRNNTIIEPQTIKNEEDKVNSCPTLFARRARNVFSSFLSFAGPEGRSSLMANFSGHEAHSPNRDCTSNLVLRRPRILTQSPSSARARHKLLLWFPSSDPFSARISR